MIKKKDCFSVFFLFTLIFVVSTFVFYEDGSDLCFINFILSIVFGYISLILGRFVWKENCNNISYKHYTKPQDLKNKYEKNSGLIFIRETYDGETDLNLTIPYVIFENINFNNAQIDLIKLSKKNKITKSIKFINCKGTVNLVFTKLDFLVVENNSTSKLNINVSNYETESTSVINALILAKKSRVSITTKTNFYVSYYLVNLINKSHLILSRNVFLSNVINNCHNIYYLLIEDDAALHIDKSVIEMNCAHICTDGEVNIYSHGFLFDEESYYYYYKTEFKDIFTLTKYSCDAQTFIIMRDDILNNRFIRKNYFGKELSFNESCQFYADFYRKNYFWRGWEDFQRIHFHFSPDYECHNIIYKTNINLGLRLNITSKPDTLTDHHSYDCVSSFRSNYKQYILYCSEDARVARLESDANYYDSFWLPFLNENSEYLEDGDLLMANFEREKIDYALNGRIKPEKPMFDIYDIIHYICS